MLDSLLNALGAYGPLVLALAMIPVAVGLPLPVGALLIASGALVNEGTMAWPAVLLWAWSGSIASDLLTYGVGRGAGPWFRGRIGTRYAAVWDRAERRFRTHGGLAVFLAGWLVRSLAVPINVIAGGSRYPVWRFVAWDTAGKLIYVLLHVGLGYFFAGRWRQVSQNVSTLGGWLGLLALAGVLLYLFLRRRRAGRAGPAQVPPAAPGALSGTGEKEPPEP